MSEGLERRRDRGDDAHPRPQAITAARPTTVDWLRTARNYVEFANDGGRYDDVRNYLASKEAKSVMK